MLLKLVKQFHGAHQVNDAEKAGIKFLIARRHSSVNLHSLKQVLHQMARSVLQRIKRPFFFAIGFGWNDYLHAFVNRLLHDGITVVGFVSQ